MHSVDGGLRLYVAAPRRIVVLYGGPGALGGMAPVARRLSGDHEVERLMDQMIDGENRDASMVRFGQLVERADAYRPDLCDSEPLDCRCETFDGVWPEARDLRQSGALLELGRRIACPVIALHGDYDRRPARGVSEPLAAVLGDFRFIELRHCGHTPCIEMEAGEPCYTALNEILQIPAQRPNETSVQPN